MKYIKWFFMVPAMLVITVLTLPLAPILALLVEEREGWHDNNTYQDWGWYLKPWLSWFQTPDNSIDGDQGWREEHWQWRFKLPATLSTYVGRVGWLLRNPGYGYGVVTLSTKDLSWIVYSDNYIYIDMGNYFQLRYTKQIGSKQLYCNFGWNIKGLAENPNITTEVCTFALSVRLI